MSTKRKLSTKLGQPTVRPNAKVLARAYINDASALVSSGGDVEEPETKAKVNGVKKNVVEISSDESSASDIDSDDFDAEADITQTTSIAKNTPTSKADAEVDEDKEMEDVGSPQLNGHSHDDADADAEENAEPSFGDLILTAPIDVASFHPAAEPHSGPLIPAPPNALSLTTVLTQALRTNDVSLLESCLQTLDAPTIRSTIQRLSSPLASTLLSKLAERLHRRPGRSGSLMVWVQWTLVTHGGYLATQKDLVAQLKELNKVIEERARSLNSLLSLKGKLDMLEAQMQLRRSMRSQRAIDEDEVDEAVIYVENSDSEDDDEDLSDAGSGTQAKTSNPRVNGIKKRSVSPSSEASEEMPNGIITEINDEESDEDDASDLIDDEAEETDADSEEEEEVDFDEVDEDDDDESEEERLHPKKMVRTSGMFTRGRK